MKVFWKKKDKNLFRNIIFSIIQFFFAGAQFVKNYSISRIISKHTSDAMAKVSRVNCAESHLNGTQLWLAIEKLSTRAVHVTSNVASVVFGKNEYSWLTYFLLEKLEEGTKEN